MLQPAQHIILCYSHFGMASIYGLLYTNKVLHYKVYKIPKSTD